MHVYDEIYFLDLTGPEIQKSAVKFADVGGNEAALKVG